MKLLTLCTLGSKMKFLSYTKIAEELEVDVDDVEMWVVDAISNKLLEASMDQFQSQVQVVSAYLLTYLPTFILCRRCHPYLITPLIHVLMQCVY